MNTVTVVLSGKGGVGKSTASVGLGRAFALMDKKVLLIDCDAGLRSLDKITAIENELMYDLSDYISGNCGITNCIYRVGGQNNLFVIPAPLSVSAMPNLEQFKKLISSLFLEFDHIILDAPAGIGYEFELLTQLANNAIVICTPDPVCARISFTVHNLLQNKGLEHRLVINKLNVNLFKKTDVFTDLDAIIDETSIHLLGVVPEDNNLVSSFFKGEFADNTKAMRAFNRIARRIDGEYVPIDYSSLY